MIYNIKSIGVDCVGFVDI